MKTTKLLTLTAFLILFNYSVSHSENMSGVKPMVCSVNSVNECIAWGGCQTVNPFAANVPTFLNIDIANNTITSATNSHTKKSTKIERVEIIDDLITLSGAEPESENHPDKFGWVITIVKGTGQMVLSANSNDSAFVIFGSCAHMSN